LNSPKIRLTLFFVRNRRKSFGPIRQNVKIALIYNPNAFCGEEADSEMRRVFERAGHEVAYISTQEPNWQHVISPAKERVIIVGGDGTVQLVVPHLKGTPFSILPFGTANNIAQCLHQTSNPELLASHLDQAEIRRLDLGILTNGNVCKSFLEAAGLGVFVELILEMQKWPKQAEMEQAESREEKFAHALEQLLAISRRCEGAAWELKADDTVIADSFLLIEVMNMELIGPNLHLAPDADPGDGYFDLVCVRERHRENLCRWLEVQSPGQKNTANFERWRCHRVEARTSDIPPVHANSHLIQKPEFPLVIELEPAALEYAVVKG
jgi:diacylglycerol kinase (ATP)